MILKKIIFKTKEIIEKQYIKCIINLKLMTLTKLKTFEFGLLFLNTLKTIV